MSDDLVEMARLAQHDERMATGALYGDLADRIEELEAKLAKVVEALIRIEDLNKRGVGCGSIARTTLVELKGEDRE